MRLPKPRTERVSLILPAELKKQLRYHAKARTLDAGHFISMQVCILELLSEYLPPVPGAVDGDGKKIMSRALRSTG